MLLSGNFLKWALQVYILYSLLIKTALGNIKTLAEESYIKVMKTLDNFSKQDPPKRPETIKSMIDDLAKSEMSFKISTVSNCCGD